jgi:hypothetical protein
MNYNPDDPRTWPRFDPLIIAHDVGRSRDRSTAVVGGNCPLGYRRLGIIDLEELPQGLYGSSRASALAVVDRRHNHNALIVVDLSNDATYAETLLDTFGTRVIGLQISRSGDGLNVERRPVGANVMFVYTIGRSQLLELFHSELQSKVVRFVDNPMSKKAYEQLMDLETELRDTGTIYKCLPGKHDDLGISCAMLAWAARHPHLSTWLQAFPRPRIRQPPKYSSWAAWT